MNFSQIRRSGMKRIGGKAASVVKCRLARLRHPRRTQLYCVGTAKSGTHSVAAMFDNTVRSQHEPEDEQVIRKILDVAAGRGSAVELRRYVRERDRQLYLEVDSSQLNGFLLEALVAEFKKARFLLTIRDPYSWLDSFINDSLRRETSEGWIMFRDLRFRANVFKHPPEETILKERGLYTLDGYLSYWAMHNQKVLSLVPREQLLVVRTDQITERAHQIAEFAGLPQESIRQEQTHAFKNPTKYRILHEINRDYLEEKVGKHCQPLMTKYFPDLRSLDDAHV